MIKFRADWQPFDKNLSLNRSEVHVWRANLDQPARIVKELERTLSTKEIGKANGFAFQHDRDRYIVSHGVLRIILGLYLKIDPDQLEFYNHPLGKPYLSGKYGQNGIRYNFSHSRNMALYALADGREIGVDLEFISYQADLDSIANKYYSPNEYNFLMSLPGDQIAQAFFTCWTCKEAYLKALGVGLALPTDQFEISLATSDSPQLVHVKGDPVEAGRWRLEVLSPAPGYTAALAAEGHDWHLSCWEYSPSLGLATFH